MEDILGDDELATNQQGDLDAVAVDIHPDELEVDFYARGSDDEEEQMNEDAQRLREIIDNDHSDDESLKSELSEVGEKLVHSNDLGQDLLPNLDEDNFVEVIGLQVILLLLSCNAYTLYSSVSPQNGRGIIL